MIVGTLRVRLLIRGAHSLKEKRRVVRSFKDRVRGKFKVSIAETDLQDQWQHAEMGIAVVGNDIPFVNSILSNISTYVRAFRAAEVYECEMEIL